jgi:hypothetical protein
MERYRSVVFHLFIQQCLYFILIVRESTQVRKFLVNTIYTVLFEFRLVCVKSSISLTLRKGVRYTRVMYSIFMSILNKKVTLMSCNTDIYV